MGTGSVFILIYCFVFDIEYIFLVVYLYLFKSFYLCNDAYMCLFISIKKMHFYNSFYLNFVTGWFGKIYSDGIIIYCMWQLL